MRHTSSELHDLCTAPPLLSMFDVRKIVLGAPHLSFLTEMWDLHLVLSRKWWEDKSVRDVRCSDVMVWRGTLGKHANWRPPDPLSWHFCQTHTWQTSITFTIPREETRVLISESAFKLMYKFRMKAVAWQ